MQSDLGPIWRSVRRSRAFLLLVLEVAIGFVIVGNLAMTIRFFGQVALPPSGHREADVVEIVSRAPAGRDGANFGRWGEERRRRERSAVAALPGVESVVPVSATQIDDRWSMPTAFWTEAAGALGPSICPGVVRSADGVVVGWTVETEATLAQAIDLVFVESDAATAQAGSVVITRCLRDALFGGATALGRTLRSNRFPPTRIVGVIEDVRMRVPFLYHTEVTALFVAPPTDERIGRYLVRTAPGQAGAVAAAAAAALGAGEPDRIVTAGLFSLGRSRSAHIGLGTVIVLVAVTGALGVVAILGNLAIAAFLVGERRRIIGVRRALGATRGDILRYLLIEALVPTQIGTLVGLAAIVAMLPAAQSRFSGLRLEPLDMLATALLLSLAGVAARLIPALRATRIPPSEASRGL